jgi:hypothetical protein
MSRINSFNTAVNRDIERAMEKSSDPVNRYMVLANKALKSGHTYDSIISELEEEKQCVLGAPIPNLLGKQEQMSVRATKLACVQGIDAVINDLRERYTPKEN